MNIRIGDLELKAVQFEDRQYVGIVRGKDKLGTEAELTIPLRFRFRADRMKPPTLDEIKEAAESRIVRFCLDTASRLKPHFVISRARMLEKAKRPSS